MREGLRGAEAAGFGAQQTDGRRKRSAYWHLMMATLTRVNCCSALLIKDSQMILAPGHSRVRLLRKSTDVAQSSHVRSFLSDHLFTAS